MSYTTLRRVSPFFVCALIGVLSSAHAQYVGPSSTKSPSTVAETLKNPIDDQEVLFRGKLLKKLSSFPGQKISESTVVEIYGEIEKDSLETPEIDVERLTIVNP